MEREEKAPPIVLTEAAKELFPHVQAKLCSEAMDLVDQFRDAGLEPGEAGSVVAHCLLRAAWLVAATGAALDGRTPIPARFIQAANATTENLKFLPPPDAKDEGE